MTDPVRVAAQALTEAEKRDAREALLNVFRFASINGWTTPNPHVVRLMEWLSAPRPAEDPSAAEARGYARGVEDAATYLQDHWEWEPWESDFMLRALIPTDKETQR